MPNILIKIQRYVINHIEKSKGIINPEDWYTITSSNYKNIVKNISTNKQLLVEKEVLGNALKIIYPHKYWKQWLLPITADNFWDIQLNERNLFNHITEQLNLQIITDWYTYSLHNLFKQGHFRGATSLFKKYDSSLQRALTTNFPEIQQFSYSWKFINAFQGFWDSPQNQKIFLKHLEQELNIKKTSDWYNVPSSVFRKYGALYFKYGSMFDLLQNNFPEFVWEPWKFKSVHNGCWNGIKGKYNRRQSLQDISCSLKLKVVDDWYKVSTKKIAKFGGATIILLYKSNSLYCFIDIFPEITWIPWKFKLPYDFWDSDENVYYFLNWCEKYFNLKSKEEWNFVTYKQVSNVGAKTLVQKYQTIPDLLQNYYPNFEWNSKNSFSGKKNQFRLYQVLQNWFKKQDIEQNYKHPNLYFKNTNKKIEFDIFLPSLDLAFEYQGKQHTEWSEIYGGSKIQKERDQQKIQICKDNSITLIEIPYFWDGSRNQILSQIKLVRPDITI